MIIIIIKIFWKALTLCLYDNSKQKKMKKLSLIIILFSFTSVLLADKVATEKPVQHLKLADLTSIDEAEKVFLEKNAELKSIKNFDEATLQEIHVITYSLEKSIGYYVKNLAGKHKSVAEAMAVEVEHIHINSENNRSDATQTHLKKYFKLAQYLPLTR